MDFNVFKSIKPFYLDHSLSSLRVVPEFVLTQDQDSPPKTTSSLQVQKAKAIGMRYGRPQASRDQKQKDTNKASGDGKDLTSTTWVKELMVNSSETALI